MKRVLLAAWPLLLPACAASDRGSLRFASGTDYEVRIVDNQEARRFDLELLSHSSKYLCLGKGQWPDAKGRVEDGSERATLPTNIGDLSAADANFGFCVGERCGIRLGPGRSLRGFIGYDQFGDPERIARLKRGRLSFPVSLTKC
jgi:hypothetical protein